MLVTAHVQRSVPRQLEMPFGIVQSNRYVGLGVLQNASNVSLPDVSGISRGVLAAMAACVGMTPEALPRYWPPLASMTQDGRRALPPISPSVQKGPGPSRWYCGRYHTAWNMGGSRCASGHVLSAFDDVTIEIEASMRRPSGRSSRSKMRNFYKGRRSPSCPAFCP